MVARRHSYRVTVRWTGNRGSGTSAYAAYSRDHLIEAPDRAPSKAAILGSSDPAFRGDATRWNPEELLLASISACHKLWYLHLAAQAGLRVTSYDDTATGTMEEQEDGSGRFIEVTLHPRITLPAGDNLTLAGQLHDDAHRYCFIANSLNFPVRCAPVFEITDAA